MHRIPRHESKCAAFHGHRYAAEITCVLGGPAAGGAGSGGAGSGGAGSSGPGVGGPGVGGPGFGGPGVGGTEAELDDRGRVIDFGVVKERVGAWIDTHWDHTAILMRGDPDPAIAVLAASNAAHGRPVYWMDLPPTAETLAAELAGVAQRLLGDTGVTVVRIRLWETPNGSAEWVADRVWSGAD